MSLIQIVKLSDLGDNEGSLVALESYKNVPFEIKRAYYIFGVKKGVSRGFHAHRNLKQVVICVAGSCRFVLDNGKQREEILLNCSTRGLIIKDLIWREMYDFSTNCILFILSSEYYDENDYIRDYNKFLKAVKDVH
jgi:dTDP-4-dehydrorhamnose 3,5-epimerase-like enzyme